MKLKIIAIGTVLIVAILGGCIGPKEVTTDTYRCTVDGGVLFLSSDNNYELLIDEIYGGGGIYGNYTVRDNEILLYRGLFGNFGDIVRFSIDGRNLIDPDGDLWVRD